MATNYPPQHGAFLPELEVDGPGPQNRLTVLFRLILLIPQYLVAFFIALAAVFVMFVSWFGALFMGRLPAWSERFLTGYLGYMTRIGAYANLLVDAYPPFSFNAPDYPVRVEVHSGRLNRAAVLFRFILAIPAALVQYVLNYGWFACSFFLWLSVLITGRTPTPVFGATAAVLRYSFRFSAWAMMLTSSYPKHVFGDPGTATSQDTQGTRPLALTSGGRALVIVFIVLGVLALAGNIGVNVYQAQHNANRMEQIQHHSGGY